MTAANPDLPAAATFFWDVLSKFGDYTDAQISAGLLKNVYASTDKLPSVPPTGKTEPAFAVLGTNGFYSLAYWDFKDETGWIVVPPPWENPILLPEYLLRRDASLGSGTNNWSFSMGPEFHIIRACQITKLAFKFGAGGLSHAWAIRKSTSPGPGAPNLNTYTDVVASGNVLVPDANVWEELTLPSAIAAAEDDWFVAQCYPGSGSGQLFSIPTARSAGQINETFAELNAGTYAFVGGSNPGSSAVPTTRVTGTLYGICSPQLEDI